MLQKKAFVKKTKKGQVLKVVREHYLRDDIWSGSPLDQECDPSAHKLSADAPHYLIIDTNLALHQMDFLEHPSIRDVIVCKTVLEEVEHRNRAGVQRLRALCSSEEKRFYVFSNEHHRDTYVKAEPGESPNDRNDRAIRVAAKWYTDRLPKMPIILLTNDAGNLQRAKEMGLTALPLAGYARSRGDVPELMDLVARLEIGEGDPMDEDGGAPRGKPAKRARVYAEHRPLSELTAGIKAGRLHQGPLRVSRFNPFEGWVQSEGVGEDILISGRVDMNRALDGDIVAVELLPEEQWRRPNARLPSATAPEEGEPSSSSSSASDGRDQGDEELDAAGAELFQVAPGEHIDDIGADGTSKRPTGRVVGIIRRNWRSRGYCGSLQPPKPGGAGSRGGGQSAYVLFVPVERRFPMIRIQTRQVDTLRDQRLVVVIDGWDTDSMYPSGHYVRSLGPIGDRDTETEVLLIENDINTAPFSPAVHECVPPLPWSVSAADLSDPHREDLRHLVVCSVDPPGCKDIDDALHVRELPNGNLEVGVHIADVTHFVKPGTAMDLEAAARATTTYLVQRRIDMLPKPLTEDICSLRGGVERLAFSAIWEMTRSADIVSTRFTKSVIKSRAALTYAEAQARIDDPNANDEVTLGLRNLMSLAKILRRGRYERGALQLASPEVKFEIDMETHDPLDVGMYQVRDTNQMVEEMMLLANIAVAQFTLSHFPSCALLRRHQSPPPRQFEPLLRAAAAAGFSLDTSSSKALAASLDTAVRPGDAYFNSLVRIMATRCMMQAQYIGSGDASAPEYHHYGLAAPLYTHFTSPIRRYADVIVHRVLAAALGIAPLPDSQRDRAAVADCADNCNKRHRGAQMAGRASVELHTLIFFKDREVVADARVTKVKANGLIVFVPKYGIEGPVYLTPKDKPHKGPGSGPVAAAAAEDQFVLDEERQMVRSKAGSVAYTVFDKCAVRIKVEEGQGRRRQLVLALVSRDQLPDKERMG